MELYSALFRSMPDIEPKVLARCREELDRGGFHPLGGNDTLEFLRRFVVQLCPRGQFAEGPPEKEAEDPKIGRAPVLFLRTRTLGFATAIEGTLEDLGEPPGPAAGAAQDRRARSAAGRRRAGGGVRAGR